MAVGGKVALLPTLGIADFLGTSYACIYDSCTILILLKVVLFSHSSCLILDKENLGFRFPCDGPGREGTCQVSDWAYFGRRIQFEMGSD